MLDSIYAAIFRPTADIRFSTEASIAIGLLAILVLALNAAGQVDAGVGGAIAFLLVFFFGGVLGWYWLSASINLLAQLLGGQGDGRATLESVAQGLWPILLTAPAIAVSDWSNLLGALFSLAVILGTFITLTIAIRRAQQFSWLSAIVCLAITLVLSGLALSGLILWPLMIGLGT